MRFVMLVTFKTRSGPRITLFGDVAKRLLKLMGLSGKVPGALAPEDVSGARRLLLEAVELSKNDEQQNSNENGEETISMRHRALPLIELLTTAAAEQAHVTWEEGRTPP